MLRRAIDQGVNYVDTAYPYHGGQSEPFLGRALHDGYREKVYLATKLPSWLINSREDMDRYLEEQLERLQTDHIDFYLLHGLSRPFWDNLCTQGIHDFLDRALADGRIRYAGFSFHDDISLFREIVDSRHWTFCQIQYNFMDEEYQAGTEGLHYAAQRGLGVVVMEPLRGGMLSKEIPAIQKIWDRSAKRRSPTEWALRWVWNHPEVTVVLSGMSTPLQVEQNLAIAGEGLSDSLLPEEIALFEDVELEYKKRIKVGCTGCGYCMPCPSGVNVPACFEQYNLASMYDSPDAAKYNYDISLGGFFGDPGLASQCKECKECEERCPQGLPIRRLLKDVVACFGR
ncbi:Aldo/keto reductase family protein [uncultured archaeon]|nr:Aldo/keto reductase family protein [uncultured archaeon]